jgi:fibronectin type 3 domain-containing protein
MAQGLRGELGLSRTNWRSIWQMIIKRSPKQASLRTACALEELEPRTLMSSLNVVATGPTSAALTWTGESGATGYFVLRSTDGTHYTQLANTASTARTYTDTTALAGHTYEYEVQANNKGLGMTPTNVVTLTTPMVTPTGLAATATPTSVSLTWTDSDASAVGYYILRSTNGGEFTQIAKTTTTAKSYKDTGLSSFNLYAYKVEAYNNNSQTSAASNVASVRTPIAPPTGLTATAATGAVTLNWTDNFLNATGYYVLRATDGVHFTQIATLTSGTATQYVDHGVLSGHAYQYQVEAVDGSSASAAASTTANTPLAAPGSLTLTVKSATSIALSWTKLDANTVGFYILRSTNGGSFTTIATIATATTTTYTDTTNASGTSYSYKVEGFAGSIVSAATDARTAITPLVAPSGLTITYKNSAATLTWVDKDTHATGYNILRSTDGTTFTQYATVTGGSATTYADSSITAGDTYYYKVQATNSVAVSPVTAAASVSVPLAGSGGVTVNIRYGDELVITETAASDSVSVSESNGQISILADGQTITESIPAAGVFIYARAAGDTINIDSSDAVFTTVDTIDNFTNTITSAGTDVSAWVNSTDTYTGTGVVHKVAAFAGNVAKTIGAALANPTDSGAVMTVQASLWGTGPVAADINQGEVGDCYFLSSLAAFAGVRTQQLQDSAVDLGDGTFAVQFMSAGKPVFVRVNDQFASGPFNGYMFAHPGTDGSIWAPVFEKAFAYFRTGANTFASINSGWMGEVYSDLGVNSEFIQPTSYTDNSLYTLLANALANHMPVTFGTGSSAPGLVSGHAYTLVSVYQSGGKNYYVVRNPWGTQGDSLENSAGYATLSFAQMTANFVEGCVATS